MQRVLLTAAKLTRPDTKDKIGIRIVLSLQVRGASSQLEDGINGDIHHAGLGLFGIPAITEEPVPGCLLLAASRSAASG